MTFRYGREDEEVMGLKFSNEAIMALAQLYPPYHGSSGRSENITPLQVSNFIIIIIIIIILIIKANIFFFFIFMKIIVS